MLLLGHKPIEVICSVRIKLVQTIPLIKQRFWAVIFLKKNMIKTARAKRQFFSPSRQNKTCRAVTVRKETVRTKVHHNFNWPKEWDLRDIPSKNRTYHSWSSHNRGHLRIYTVPVRTENNNQQRVTKQQQSFFYRSNILAKTGNKVLLLKKVAHFIRNRHLKEAEFVK